MPLSGCKKKEFGEYFVFLTVSIDSSVAVPYGETLNSRNCFILREEALFRPYLPGHLRKRSTICHQLVVPSVLRALALNTCHDFPASGGHLDFKANFD